MKKTVEEKYALKAKAERAPALEKAKTLIRNPSHYNRATSSGVAKYVKYLTFDPQTGEILEDAKKSLLLVEEKVKESDERIAEADRSIYPHRNTLRRIS